MSIVDDLPYSTLRIKCFTKLGISTGTGSIVNLAPSDLLDLSAPALITNKHVMEDAESCEIVFHLKNSDGTLNEKENITVTIDNLENKILNHPDENCDICALFLSADLSDLLNKEIHVFYRQIPIEFIPTSEQINQIRTVEDILMVGYPNGLWDETNNLPLIRRGITSTHYKFNFNNNPWFVIDAACYNGSSGSPVFILNEDGYGDNLGNVIMGRPRIYFLGILFGGPVHTAHGNVIVSNNPLENPTTTIQIPNNLGYCIKSGKLSYFIDVVKQNLKY